jgi:hypothetical protein
VTCTAAAPARRAAPTDPRDVALRMRAQSLLCGLPFRDGSTQAPPLSTQQARDVLAWHDPSPPPRA